ncbi:MAG: MFS transporter [Yaniella sp.]
MTTSAPSPKMQRTLTPALLAVMCIALFGFGTFFLNYSTLVSIGANMGLTAVAAGTILTIMMVAVVAVQPLAPVLNNHFGPRMTFFAALSLQAAGNLLSLLTHFPLFALVSGSVVGGLGFGILVVIGTAAVPSTVAPERLGKALGYFGVTTSGATAIGAPAGLWLINIMPAIGFRWLAFGFILLALPALLAIPQQHQTSNTASRDVGQPVDGRMRWGGLITVLLPVSIVLTTFGLLLAFGPAAHSASPALYIVSMQIFAIIGRFLASSSLDRRAPVSVMSAGIVVTLIGLMFTALLPAGTALIIAMMVLGFGIGAVQASSLLLCFEQSGSTNRGSVAWNMTFDIGLGVAGLVGGFGFTYWGPAITYIVCAIALTMVGLFFALYFLSPKNPQAEQAPIKR